MLGVLWLLRALQHAADWLLRSKDAMLLRVERVGLLSPVRPRVLPLPCPCSRGDAAYLRALKEMMHGDM